MKAKAPCLAALLLLLFFLVPLTGSAAPCSYCGKLDKIKAGFASIKPDPRNIKTIDLQDKLVDETTDLVSELLHKNHRLSPEDLKRVVEAIAVAEPYDYQNLMPEVLEEDVGGKRIQAFYQELTSGLDSGVLDGAQVDRVRLSLGMAESVREEGTDPYAPAENEADPNYQKKY